jgi:hypothetical protein
MAAKSLINPERRTAMKDVISTLRGEVPMDDMIQVELVVSQDELRRILAFASLASAENIVIRGLRSGAVLRTSCRSRQRTRRPTKRPSKPNKK